jgi:hypothetical protein
MSQGPGVLSYASVEGMTVSMHSSHVSHEAMPPLQDVPGATELVAITHSCVSRLCQWLSGC